MATYRMTVLATASGQQIRNVLHVTHGGSATKDQLAGSFRNAWQTRICPLLHTSYLLQGVECVNIDNDDAPGYAPATIAGGTDAAGQAASSFICASVRWNTARRGRSFQGRLGLGPLSTARVSTNQLDPTWRAGAAGNLETFRTDIQSSGGAAAMLLSVVSLVSNGAPRPVPIVEPVTSVSVNSLVGTRLSRHARTGS